MKCAASILFTTCLLLSGPCLAAEHGVIVAQDRDAAGEGYTVLRLWGTPAEMGYAHGEIFADEILAGVEQLRDSLGETVILLARQGLAITLWPANVEAEIAGMVEGIKAARPTAVVDELDIKVLNTYGDWAYVVACRSHAAWGSRAAAPFRSIATRRLDFGVPETIAQVRHHVLAARQPASGVRWVNLAWAGYVNAVTAVNEYGTLASLHDYQSEAAVGPYMPRTVAVRYVLTSPSEGAPLEDHLGTAELLLAAKPISTGTFINLYVPEGHGGVFTCSAGAICHKLRRPQSDYYEGEVLITTNAETDGKSTPAGGDFMAAFYDEQPLAKTPEASYELMGHDGMHLLTVGYRDRNDIALLFEGRVSEGTTPRVELEFASLFDDTLTFDAGIAPDAQAGPLSDGGAGPADLAVDAAGETLDAGNTAPRSGGGGCGVGGSLRDDSFGLLLIALGLLLRRRREPTSSSADE